jgi:hypothetical protein
MKILLAAVLATVIAAPCMAKDGDEDRSPADVQTPGKTEPRVPDTLKSAPAQRIQSEERIQTEGRAKAGQPAVNEKERGLNDKSDGDKK